MAFRVAAIVALLAILLLPSASALPVEDPGPGPGEGGPCYDQPCFSLPPLTQDPAPLGADTTKLSAGGSCRPGSYGVACETSQCLGTFWIWGPCEESSTCALYARTLCIAGVNQKRTMTTLDIVLHRPGPDPTLLPHIPPQHVTAPGVGVGGDCSDHTVSIACNYHVSPDECINLDPDPNTLFDPRDCVAPTIFCVAYVDAVGCAEGLAIQPGAACGLALNTCAPACDALAELSATVCSTGGTGRVPEQTSRRFSHDEQV